MRKEKMLPMAGLIGAGLIILSSVISAFLYVGKYGEQYSFLNHFISELGEAGVSKGATVFNAGLFLGGLFLTFFMTGVATYLGGWFGILFGVVSVVTGLSGALVGIFPMNNLTQHMRVALTFFYSGMVTTILFSVYVLFSNQEKFHKLIAVPGVLTAISFFSFLFLTDPLVPQGQWHQLPEVFANRPQLWRTAIFEWAVLVTVLAFVIVVSISILVNSKTNHHPSPENKS